MSGEPKEVEAKFLARDPGIFRALGRLKTLGRFRLLRAALERQENRYLDTEDLRLRQARAVLKLRRTGSKREVTFKREIGYRAGVSERIEVSGPQALLRARKITGSRPFKEILNLRTRRRSLIFAAGRERIELDLDRVEVRRASGGTARYAEAELENLSASEIHFREALTELKHLFPKGLRPSRLPKVEIGLRLLKGKTKKGRDR